MASGGSGAVLRALRATGIPLRVGNGASLLASTPSMASTVWLLPTLMVITDCTVSTGQTTLYSIDVATGDADTGGLWGTNHYGHANTISCGIGTDHLRLAPLPTQADRNRHHFTTGKTTLVQTRRWDPDSWVWSKPLLARPSSVG